MTKYKVTTDLTLGHDDCITIKTNNGHEIYVRYGICQDDIYRLTISNEKSKGEPTVMIPERDGSWTEYSQCEQASCQHKGCLCGHAECGHANENVQPNCSDCDCNGFEEAK